MKATKLPSGMWRVLAYAGKDRSGRPVRKSFSGPDKRKVLSDAAAWVDEHRKVDDTSCTFGDAADPQPLPPQSRASELSAGPPRVVLSFFSARFRRH